MSREFIYLKDFEQLGELTKEDLDKIVMLPDGRDFHGREYYQYVTVWSLLSTDDFNRYIKLYTIDDVINYRDYYDSNILFGIAEASKPLSWFQTICEIVGDSEFETMLKTKGRISCCPFAVVRDFNAFVAMVNVYSIDNNLLRQISEHGTRENVDYLTMLINEARESSACINNDGNNDY